MPVAPPSDEASLFYEGNRLLGAGDPAGAAGCYRQACARNPQFAEGWANLALALERCGDAAGAEHAYRQALANGCSAMELHLNFGALLTAQRRFDEALASYAQALRLDYSSAHLWSNLGALYLGMQQDDDALTCLERALQLKSDHASAQVNLAYLHLRHGHFARGWRALEGRNWYAAAADRLPCPRWRGEPLQGTSLLLLEEAGHGDVIQFVRYAAKLKAQGVHHITLVCHASLADLMQTAAGVDQVCSPDAALAHASFDYWSPLLSLPFHFETRADTIPAEIPYLQADPLLLAQWGARLHTADAWEPTRERPLRVGLAWKGNPLFENDSQRSIAHFELLAPLLAIPGVTFFSLQKGAGQDEPAELNARRASQDLPAYPVTAFGEQLHSFADTAAIVQQLDLVISVDTAVAHLAGALGVRCWVLLPDYMADWRWGVNDTESAWYPGTMRLWRQSRGGDWPPLIASVAQTLHNLPRNPT